MRAAGLLTGRADVTCALTGTDEDGDGARVASLPSALGRYDARAASLPVGSSRNMRAAHRAGDRKPARTLFTPHFDVGRASVVVNDDAVATGGLGLIQSGVGAAHPAVQRLAGA